MTAKVEQPRLMEKLPLSPERQDWLKSTIRDIPDFPKPGIIFKDLTTLMRNAEAFSCVLNSLSVTSEALKPTVIVGIEARGFILAPALAHHLGVGFVPVRKPGKLPWHTERVSYALEYGEDTVEVHRDAVTKGDRVVIIDDLLATGGTAMAAKQLMEKLGATVVGAGFVVELDFLDGRSRVKKDGDLEIFSVIQY
ncbi:MAG TPA: adenine phosphoribosyltransferase [Candidatus Obscuribacter sp.]|nr:adenine phosphoribosyltransferase [Candidatus Obscuribacter sp.]